MVHLQDIVHFQGRVHRLAAAPRINPGEQTFKVGVVPSLRLNR